jgi:CheY-specific phosphatase CheX
MVEAQMNPAFDQARLEQQLTDAAADVLGTMFFASVDEDLAGAPVGFAAADRARLATLLPFSGACSGSLAVSLDRSTAGTLAANFFGELSESETEQDCRMVMAELTNMVCGAMLSRLDRQCIFCLGSPEILPPGPEVDGEVVRTLMVENGLLRLAFSIGLQRQEVDPD